MDTQASHTQSADAQVSPAAELESRVAELTGTLAQAREALDAAERRHEIDLALVEAGAIDLETARLVADAVVSRQEQRDVKKAVRELRSTKGFLFAADTQVAPTNHNRRARVPGRAPGIMGAKLTPSEPAPLRAAADAAAASGDRGDLLRYLRAKRLEA